MLVVDPGEESADLATAMAGHGAHLSWSHDSLDGLIEFGRIDPHVVVFSPDTPGMAPLEFVRAVVEHGSTYLVIGVTGDIAEEAGELVVAGAHGVVGRPYDADGLAELLHRTPRSLDDHARVSYGPICLDAGAYNVHVDGERLDDLPLKEFELLRALLLAAPGVVTDDALREALWGTAGPRPSGNTIAMHVTRLRHRLAGIATVRRIRGRGYSLSV